MSMTASKIKQIIILFLCFYSVYFYIFYKTTEAKTINWSVNSFTYLNYEGAPIKIEENNASSCVVVSSTNNAVPYKLVMSKDDSYKLTLNKVLSSKEERSDYFLISLFKIIILNFGTFLTCYLLIFYICFLFKQTDKNIYECFLDLLNEQFFKGISISFLTIIPSLSTFFSTLVWFLNNS